MLQIKQISLFVFILNYVNVKNCLMKIHNWEILVTESNDQISKICNQFCSTSFKVMHR